jgi:ferredoxin-NADP reductase
MAAGSDHSRCRPWSGAPLHDEVDLRKTVMVLPPENDFPLDQGATYSVLTGGIGITPILAMARELEASGRSAATRYSTEGTGEAAFLDEVRNSKAARSQFYDTSLGPEGRMRL